MKKFLIVFIVVSARLISFVSKNPVETTPYPFKKMKAFTRMPVSEENPVTVEGAELGRYLFYDTRLSVNESFSCGSCHIQKYAFADEEKRFSTGVHGDTMKRNTPGLFNLAWYPQMFWDGRSPSIEDQVFHPVRAHDEMDLDWNIAAKRIRKDKFYRKQFKIVFGTSKIDSTHIAFAIAQFERTLVSHDSRFDKAIRGELFLTKEEYKGFELMNDQTKGDCLHCHTTDANAVGTTGKMSNNGLDAASINQQFADNGFGDFTGKIEDNGKFKIPSLRNLLFTAPYMHDGRFKTLEEVLEFYSSGVKRSHSIDSKMEFVRKGGAQLTQYEKDCILAFLKTMSDSTFVKNPEFSNPFK